MKQAVLFLVIAVFAALGSSASAQDTLVGLGEVRGYTGVVFDTRNTLYDLLVDASRPADPAARRYRTLEAAVEAAPEGTRERPTVIGLMPDVYLLHGDLDEPGLTISKDNITLVGLTDDRRKVVIADNRGNTQGANNNGWSMAVNADGFSAINLTFLNFCNVDYDYPGDPSKSLRKRSTTITQAVALQISGDRHYFSHVALLSRLDTFVNRTTRSYFTHSYIEGTDDFLGGRGPSVWEDSEINFITGGGILYGGGTTFIRTRFRASEPMEFYKALVPPDALIDSVLPNVTIAWHAWRQPPTLSEHSFIYNTLRQDGRDPDIIDSAVGEPRRLLTHRLTDDQARAFNPWNLLRWNPEGVDDGWDPAGARARFEPFGILPYRVTMAGGAARVRTTEDGAEISAQVFPAGSTRAIRWVTDSNLVRLSSTSGGTITVTGTNNTDRTEVVTIRALADNGLFATAYVTVDPPYQPAPAMTGQPTLRMAGGAFQLTYNLPLTGPRRDQTRVTWFVCAERVCADPKRVAVSRADHPLKSLTVTPAMAGLWVMATVEPKHDLSKPGPAYKVISAAPVRAVAPPLEAALNLLTQPDNAYADLWDGDWRIRGAWITEPPMDGEPRWGLRVGGAVSTLLYNGRRSAGDLDVTLEFDTDKLEGQGFAMPSSPDDDARLRADILFKYDDDTRTGYAVRMWRTTQASNATMFQIYRITEGRGTPVGEPQLTGVLKPTTTIRITVRGRRVTVTGVNTTDGETLSLSADIEPNRFAGAGIYWPSSSRGGSIVLRRLTVVAGE